MLDRNNGVSQENLADVIASAVDIDSQRIEQLGDDVVSQIDGGGNTVRDVIDIIIGLILGDNR